MRVPIRPKPTTSTVWPARNRPVPRNLAIASENAQLHGGHIQAGNHPAGGAVFTLSLPLNSLSPASGTMPPAVPAV